jgi:hypothetical protein
MSEPNKQCNHDETNKCDCPCHNGALIMHFMPCCFPCKICGYETSYKKEVDTQEKVMIKELNQKIEKLQAEVEEQKKINKIYLNIIQNIYNLTKFIQTKTDEPQELKPIIKKIFLETFRIELDRWSAAKY